MRTATRNPESRSGRQLAWIALAFCGLAAANLVRAANHSAWAHQQEVRVPEPGVVRLSLPASTLDAANPSRSDLRLVDPSGQEIPFSLEVRRPAAAEPMRPRAFTSRLAGDRTVLVISAGTNLPLDFLELASASPRFLKSALLETSPDGESWTVLDRDLPVFRQWGAQQLRLPLGGRPAPFVRITLDDARSQPVVFSGAALLASAGPQPAEEDVGSRIVRPEEFEGETLLSLELEGRHLPLSRLSFATDGTLFTRRITIKEREVRDERTTERLLGEGTIYRLRVPGVEPRESLSVRLDCTPASRQLLVHVHHGDSPPLPFSEVNLHRREVALLFDASTAGTFTLLSGNPQAAAPRYDVAAFTRDLRAAPARLAAVGPLVANPAYQPPVPLANVPLTGAPLDPAPWPLRKPVSVQQDGVQQLELDLEVLSRARADYGDLRLLSGGNQVPYLLEATGLTRPLELVPIPEPDPKRPGWSRWKIILPRDRLPLRRLTFISPTPLFQRGVRLIERLPSDRTGTYESFLGRATWSRRPGDDTSGHACTLDHAPQGDTLYLETDNGDNPPITLSHATAAYPAVRLVFKARNGEQISLLYGRGDLAAPRYDLSLVAAELLGASRAVAQLGAEEGGDGSLAAKALAGFRGGPLFWGALALVVIVLLVVIARLLPKATPPA